MRVRTLSSPPAATACAEPYSSRPSRRIQLVDSLARGRLLDHRGQPPRTCLRPLRADYPPCRLAAIGPRLPAEEVPRRAVLAEGRGKLLGQLGRTVLVGVDPGPRFGPGLERP